MILQDVFPAIALVMPSTSEVAARDVRTSPPTPGGYQIVNCRVIVTKTKILVVKDGNLGPEIVLSAAITQQNFFKSSSIRDKHSYVTTDDGRVVAFRRESSCACGSRLRSWNPFKNGGLSSINDPTE